MRAEKRMIPKPISRHTMIPMSVHSTIAGLPIQSSATASSPALRSPVLSAPLSCRRFEKTVATIGTARTYGTKRTVR
mgnify:CR=1 FL=1